MPPSDPDRVDEVRTAMLDTLEGLGIKTTEPETIAKVLYQSGALPYPPSIEAVEEARETLL